MKRACRIVETCRRIAACSEQPGRITRTFLSPPMHDVHRLLRSWMEDLGMCVTLDAAGNLRGVYPGTNPAAPRLLIGSHLDTVPDAGAFDGVLGVVFGIALIEALAGSRLPFAIEVIGFSEEEGVRFGVPFIGSRALIGDIDDRLLAAISPALHDFGLDPANIADAALRGPVLGYVEFHIEQGPVLDSLHLPLGIVTAIAGQTRANITFQGRANHAGTTPMHLREDALVAAAEWIVSVAEYARGIPGLVATVGHIEVLPNAGNVIAGEVRATLDVRHADDAIRRQAVEHLLRSPHQVTLDQPAVPCDEHLTACLERAVEAAGFPLHRMISGAGHDAMIVARQAPVAMLFLRSPGGISHHPSEAVLEDDVEAALQTGRHFLDQWEARYA